MTNEWVIPTNQSQPFAIAAGSDGALWFTENGINSRLGRITTAGVITEFAIPAIASDIVAGSDGALWFPTASGIGRITTAGIVSMFPVPSGAGVPFRITAGPDGALWYLRSLEKIGRMTTAGIVTAEFAVLHAPDFAATAIATGSDGAIWVTEPSIPKVTRVATDGTATSFDVFASLIAPGPGAAIWYARNGTVGKVTSTGAFTEKAQTNFLNPAAITAGPDGAMWLIVDNVSRTIARVNSELANTEFLVSNSNITMADITTGPDGVLWVTERTANKIGRYAPPQSILDVLPVTAATVAVTPGGPFSVNTVSSQLSASSGSVAYSISGVPTWLTPSSTSGTLTSTPTAVDFTLNANAASLPFGTYNSTIIFTNTTNGMGTQTRAITLMVISSVAHDFDADGKSDIIWRRNNGDVAIWLMNGPATKLSANFGNVLNAWSIVGQSDFNRDGKRDLLWRYGAFGDLAMWRMNGALLPVGLGMGTVAPNWIVVGTSDFDGDYNGDILWRDSLTGDVAVWLMSGTTPVQVAGLGNVSLDWTVAATADFDGDSKADILWRNTVTGDVSLWFMNGVVVSQAAGLGSVPASWSIVGTGDFDGDRKTDILWRDTSGNLAIWIMNGANLVQGAGFGNVTTDWTVAGTGDFDGDHKADILWRNSSTGDNAMWFMNGIQISSTAIVASVPTDWTFQSLNAN